MWRISAIRMTVFPTPSVNLVSEELTLTAVCWTEMREPPLTANWNSGDRCIAYVTRNDLLSGKIYLPDKLKDLCNIWIFHDDNLYFVRLGYYTV